MFSTEKGTFFNFHLRNPSSLRVAESIWIKYGLLVCVPSVQQPSETPP